MGWETLRIQTAHREQMLDITAQVQTVVSVSGVAEGLCHVFVPHTTAGVSVNEGADPDVARDIEAHMARAVPREASFRHAEGNSDSHVKTVIVGSSLTLPVRGGRLALGTWQAIFLCEWDGPRPRNFEVAVSAL
jgi:secondary thiamine-phosphate synthase enzyme